MSHGDLGFHRQRGTTKGSCWACAERVVLSPLHPQEGHNFTRPKVCDNPPPLPISQQARLQLHTINILRISIPLKHNFLTNRPPEIMRVPLEQICLQIKMLHVNCTIAEFLQQALQPPAMTSIQSAITVRKDPHPHPHPPPLPPSSLSNILL